MINLNAYASAITNAHYSRFPPGKVKASSVLIIMNVK